MTPDRSTASRRPDGDHEGERAPRTSSRGRPPALPTTYTLVTLSWLEVRSKATQRPSGDHAGSSSLPAPRVSRLRPPPPGRIVKISERIAKAILPLTTGPAGEPLDTPATAHAAKTTPTRAASRTISLTEAAACSVDPSRCLMSAVRTEPLDPDWPAGWGPGGEPNGVTVAWLVAAVDQE
jgi:hypothetical protein